MIKRVYISSLFLLLPSINHCVLAQSNYYVFPNGPFKSELILDNQIVLKQKMAQDQLKFIVPDLGRYREKNDNGGNNLNQSFNDSSYSHSTRKAETLESFNNINNNANSAVTNFDDLLPQANNLDDDRDYYPPEWMQPNPLRQQRHYNNQYQPQPQNYMPHEQQYNSFMGMPMPKQMMPNQMLPSQMLPWQNN